MEGLLNQVSDSPIVAFTVLLMVTLTIPPLFERLRLPGSGRVAGCRGTAGS